jgi:hypothetical protein
MITYNEILATIESKYHSLVEPDFAFVKQALDKDPFKDLRQILEQTFILDDYTDPNDDVSFVYNLHTAQGAVETWSLWLSMVGPYALFIKHQAGTVKNVIDLHSDTPCAEEELVVNVCGQFHLILLDRAMLSKPVPLKLFVTEPENVTVFQALFSDRDLPPWERLDQG